MSNCNICLQSIQEKGGGEICFVSCQIRETRADYYLPSNGARKEASEQVNSFLSLLATERKSCSGEVDVVEEKEKEEARNMMSFAYAAGLRSE